ncbi:hypothetical protein MKW92_039051 [Papaver armeniacum]|nr:hypothetical protein MKW92_039051 [Papaver armeniacum]
MALRHNEIGVINFIATLLSIPIIGAGIWLTTLLDNSCIKILQWPVVILGISILVVGIAGLSGHIDYSGWLCRIVQVSYKWDQIRACLSSTSMCTELNRSYHFAQDFFNARITPLQSGCCKPPTQCGFTFVNPTYWISPINAAADMDCLKWSNEQTQLCYGCDSCKAGLLANIKNEWRRVHIILLITLIALICVYLVGCCEFRKAKTEDLFREYVQDFPLEMAA